MSKKHGLHGQLGDPSKVPGVLNEDYSRAFDLIEELKNCGLSSDDILRDLIGRIGGYAAEKYLLDIKRVEIGSYCDDDEDDSIK